ncbi:MAG: CapA family protein [Reyranellaceae bacterium]
MFNLILAGDAMLGRGIDQIQRHPCDPALRDPRTNSAVDFVRAAEAVNGPIPRLVEPGYVWGDAPQVLAGFAPSLLLVNLETALTTASEPAPRPITYRMNPMNAEVLQTLGVDCCALANNHVLDWGRDGLSETLRTLDGLGIAHAGAGDDLAAAWRPARLARPDGGHVLVVSLGIATSGVPRDWAARADAPGVAYLEGRLDRCVETVAAALREVRQPGDIAVASIHWGPNWGYEVAPADMALARALIDHAGIDIVHGHSSHHPRQIAVHRGRPIFLGCGDLINDYEGIRRYERHGPRLAALYAVAIEGTAIRDIRILPFRLRRFRLERAGADDVRWLAETVNRHSRSLGTVWMPAEDGTLRLMALSQRQPTEDSSPRSS